MSTVERKEYQATKILRTVSPVRGARGSGQNLSEFDNNLDNLLEDLQSSVSRPGSSLGNKETYRSLDSGRSSSLTRASHLKSSLPVTEYSETSDGYTSPDGTRSYKKESYSYKSSNHGQPEKVLIKNNINQLDSLLDDLKQVKQTSIDKGSYNNVGIDPSLINESSSSKLASSKRTVQRELHYGETPRSSSRSRTVERNEREGSLQRETQYSSEGTYADIKSIRHTTPSPTRGDTLSKQTKVTNIHSYPVEVVETVSPDINPEILAQLDPNLLPPGNTKVTTTIKTYTYEIPGSGYQTTPGDTDKYVYSPNQSSTTPSKSFVYNKAENQLLTKNIVTNPEPGWHNNVYKETSSENVSQNYGPHRKPVPPNSDKALHKETVTTRNYQPGYIAEYGAAGKQTYVYNETTTTRNINEGGTREPGYLNGSPPVNYEPRNKTYIINEVHDTTNTNAYPNRYPPPHQEPNKTTVIYRNDTRTTNSYAPPPSTTTVIYNKTDETESFDPKHPPYPRAGSGRPAEPRGPVGGRPNEPHDPNLNITYKYSSRSSSTNNYKGAYPPGEESEPLIHTRPFPTESESDGPPRRLDDLMATIGNEPPNSPYNAGFTAHEAELAQQKKIDTLKHKHEAELQKKEPRNSVTTKNVTGPPVYYPPGHELFAKKEESGAWRAEGAMAKESGKYKYEAESSSKMKSSSGATIVPVCLPLCCGLPCALL